MSNLLEKEVKLEYTKPVVFFNCMRCGCCCEHLIKDTQYGKMSLFLKPEEAKWFPQEKVVPQYAVGVRGHSRPRPYHIFAFQLNSMVCTWFDRQKRTCMIRNMRPMACRAYPVTHGSIDINCKFIQQFTSEENQRIDVNPTSIKQEVAADQNVVNHIKESMKGQGTLWAFSLDKRKWEVIASRPVIKPTIQLPNFKASSVRLP